MKKFIIVSIVAMFVLSANTLIFATDETEITSGTYYQLGEYNGNPILWRAVVSDDENGILMVSDKILSYRIFNVETDNKVDNHWENTAMRVWLNSVADSGEVEWFDKYVPSSDNIHKYYSSKNFTPYADEKGFLNNDNFTDSEKSVMKTVSHWQALSEDTAYMSENGLRKPFYPKIVKGRDSQFEQIVYRYKIEDMYRAYYGAMYRVNDTVFTLDEKQLCNVLSQLGTVAAENAEGAEPLNEDDNGIYWLRTPMYNLSITTATNDGGYGLGSVFRYELGVRPAFYLNEENMIIKSGSGTADDPYILDGKMQNDTAVFCNSEQVEFDVQPIEENGRLLVPVRAIFEELGAEVTYDDGDGVITATNDERTVVMQIDNPEMGNGTEVFTLEVAPKLVNDRTLVPLRAVAEAFDCKVEWIEGLNRAVIDPPQPEDTDEGHWQHTWDISVNGEGKK